MPACSVGLRATAEKQLAALDRPVRERVAAAIDALAENPRPLGVIAMQGTAGLLVTLILMLLALDTLKLPGLGSAAAFDSGWS